MRSVWLFRGLLLWRFSLYCGEVSKVDIVIEGVDLDIERDSVFI